MNSINFSKFVPWLIIGALAIILVVDVKMHCTNPSTSGTQTGDSSFYWQNKYGDAFASLMKTKLEFGVERRSYLDSIASLNNTKANLIQEVINFRIRGADTIYIGTPTDIVTLHDTLNPKCPDQVISLSKKFSDPYYTADVTIDRMGQHSRAIVQNFDTLRVLFKTVKSGGFLGMFQKEDLQLDVHTESPYSHIDGLHAYRVPPPSPKKWGIGIIAGWGYGFNAVGGNYGYPIVGIGISRNFIRF
jgi:hypothetical protein